MVDITKSQWRRVLQLLHLYDTDKATLEASIATKADISSVPSIGNIYSKVEIDELVMGGVYSDIFIAEGGDYLMAENNFYIEA